MGGTAGSAALLIAALRRIALGQTGCALTRRDFAIGFPGAADEVFATFRAFLQALARAGRRKLRVGLPGQPAMPDEMALVALLAAAQGGRRRAVRRPFTLADASRRAGFGIAHHARFGRRPGDARPLAAGR